MFQSNSNTHVKAVYAVLLVVIALSLASLACGGPGGQCGDTVKWSDPECQAYLHQQGSEAVNSVANGRSKLEQAAHDLVGCDPKTALYGCNPDGTFK